VREVIIQSEDDERVAVHGGQDVDGRLKREYRIGEGVNVLMHFESEAKMDREHSFKKR
jgi:hypothetical protein